jgi:hypothetical protein
VEKQGMEHKSILYEDIFTTNEEAQVAGDATGR